MAMHGFRYAVAIVDYRQAPLCALAGHGDEYLRRMRITRISEQFENDALDIPDVLYRLPALCFRRPETHEAIPKVMLDSEMARTADFFYE